MQPVPQKETKTWGVQKGAQYQGTFDRGCEWYADPSHSKKNRKKQREYDKYLYKLHHLVENAFLKLKRWRGVATRYAKTTKVFVSAVIACCILQ